MKTEESLRDLGDSIKHTNICIIGVPEGDEREKRPEKIAKNFPNGKGIIHSNPRHTMSTI